MHPIEVLSDLLEAFMACAVVPAATHAAFAFHALKACSLLGSTRFRYRWSSHPAAAYHVCHDEIMPGASHLSFTTLIQGHHALEAFSRRQTSSAGGEVAVSLQTLGA